MSATVGGRGRLDDAAARAAAREKRRAAGSSATATPRLRRMPGIDGLRAIAVTAVFLYHAHPSWLPGGFLGVDVFFVISGYLITSLLLAEWSATGAVSLRAFWLRRARRLLPALYLLLGVCLLLGATVERGQFALRDDALAAIFYVANWRFVFAHVSYFAQFGRPPLFRHLWSLAVEEQFYLVWPLLFVLASRLRRRALPFLVAAGAAGSTALMWLLYTPGRDTSRVFYGTDTRATPLLVGVLLAFVWKPDALPKVRVRAALDAAALVALAAVVWMFVAVHDSSPFVYRGGFLVLATAAAVLLGAVAHPASLLARLLARPVPRWLGERSYGIYLWHWPVLVLSRPADATASGPLAVVLQAAATLALAECSYRFVEQPIRSGALRRLGLGVPRLAAATVVALVGLAALTPPKVQALPPGFTRAALAASARASTHLVLQRHPAPARQHQARAAPRAPQASTSHHRTASIPRSGPILAVGDSVLLGTSAPLQASLGPDLHIDAVVARQIDATIARLQAYRAEGALPKRVILQVGDNGPVYWADWMRLKQALMGVPLVVLVNVRVNRSWQHEVNDEMRQVLAVWHHATIADWYDASSSSDLVDGVHTTAAGADRFAAVVARAVRSPNLGGVTR